MDNIEKIVINNFKNNLEFFKNYDNKLYQRLIVLDDLIQTNQYSPRYELEYIQDDKEFDIFDTKTDKYIYDKRASLFIKNSLKDVDFNKINSIDLLEPNLYNRTKLETIDDSLRLQEKVTNLLANDIFEYTKLFQKSTTYKYKQFKYIDKFIFVGVLLGTHIEKIDKKIDAKVYFIYESNLEIFRLSLFTTDYSKLANKSKLIFSIMDDDIELDSKLITFSQEYQRSNYMMKYYSTNYNINNFFDKFFSLYLRVNPFNYIYYQILDNLITLSLERISKYNILDTSKQHKLLEDKKVLFLAAGPSLKNNIEWIKENKNKFFIVTIGATIKTIISSGVSPDLIISIDPDDIILNQFPKNTHKDIKKIPFIGAISTHQSVLDIFKNITLIEVMSRFKESSSFVAGNSVGEITLHIISILGAKEIYMLGTDMALDQETGATHTDEHIHNTIFDISSKEIKKNSFMENENYDKNNTMLSVKGNFRDKVITTSIMQTSIYAYGVIIEKILQENSSLNIYNLCDGAYLRGTIPTLISSVELNNINKKYNKKDTLKYLTSISSSSFNISERANLNNSLDVVNILIDEIKRLDKLKIKTYDKFGDERVRFINIVGNSMRKFEPFYLNKLFITYYVTMEQYMGYHFNDKNLKDEANLLKKVKKIWCNDILKLAYKYKELVLNKSML
ncbi:MAG: 6-hydroxymethylpterin diphosphokinase MptE-like protein [Campylobacterota bacterium]|nr:6-hydroxymethylpterin diphosphokinase MptE-like protein [Campylobacterota bacterium]